MSKFTEPFPQDEPQTIAELEQTVAEIGGLLGYTAQPYQPPETANPSEHTLLRFAHDQARGFGEAAAKSSITLITYRQTSEALWHAATHDSLTGLLNRAGLASRLESKPTPQVLLYLDATNFKAVNDTRGHARGDGAIVAIADILRQAMRENDMIARDGGDEFVAVLDNTNNHDIEQLRRDAESTRQRIEAALQQYLSDPANHDLVAVGFTIAIGIAIRESGVSYDQLKDLAERDMTMHKRVQHDELGQHRS